MTRKAFLARFGDADTAIKSIDPSDHVGTANAASNPSLTAKHLDDLLSHEHPRVRTAVFYNPNATKEHITKALKDTNTAVRAAAIRHPLATKEQAQQLINSGAKDWELQCAKNVLWKY